MAGRLAVPGTGTGGMSCGEKVNCQRSGWRREGVGGVGIGIKYKSTGSKVNWRCRLFWVGWAGIGRRGQGDVSFRGLKVAGNGSPRKLDWRLIVAKGAVVMGLGSVDCGYVVQSLGDRRVVIEPLLDVVLAEPESEGVGTWHPSLLG